MGIFGDFLANESETNWTETPADRAERDAAYWQQLREHHARCVTVPQTPAEAVCGRAVCDACGVDERVPLRPTGTHTVECARGHKARLDGRYLTYEGGGE